MDLKLKSKANQPLSIQSQLSESDVGDEKENCMEDFESLLEGLPMPRPSDTSLSDNFDIVPDNRSGLVTVTSSQRLMDTYEHLLSALAQTTQKCDQLMNEVNSISTRLQILEQKQQEISGSTAEQQIHCQQLIDRLQTVAENSSTDYLPVAQAERLSCSTERLALIEEAATAQVVRSATAPICFLLELYPRPGNGLSGRIHHTLSKQAASFKGLNLEQILPFIKKYLPQLAEHGARDEPIMTTPAPERPVKPAEQITSIIQEPPRQTPVSDYSCIKEIGLIQDRQKTTKFPFRLQARKRFAVIVSLDLPMSQQDALKSNEMLRYVVEIEARHLPHNRIACKLLQHGGMNSKFPKDTRALYMDTLPPGNYVLDIKIVMPQKNISEQRQLEINVM